MHQDPRIVALAKTRRRVAAICALLMLLVVVASAYMRHQATVIDPTAVPIPIEWARNVHRAAATLVLLGALLLIALARRGRDRGAGALAWGLLATALMLSALGISAGASRAPGVVLLNLLGGFAMLALCTRLASAPALGTQGRLRHAASWLLALALMQAALGAWAGSDVIAECTGSSSCAWPPTLHRFAGITLGWAVLLFGTLVAWTGKKAGRVLVVIVLTTIALGMGGSAAGGASAPLLVVLHNALAALTIAMLARLV